MESSRAAIGGKRAFSRTQVAASIVLLKKQEPSERNGTLSVMKKSVLNSKKSQRPISTFFMKNENKENVEKEETSQMEGKLFINKILLNKKKKKIVIFMNSWKVIPELAPTPCRKRTRSSGSSSAPYPKVSRDIFQLGSVCQSSYFISFCV